MEESSLNFLERLLDAAGPSGYELPAARVWREEAERVADRVDADVSGNSLAVLNPGGAPRVMLAGHIDEIGLIVTHIDDDGYVYLDGIGGWDSQVLVGQRVRFLSREARDRPLLGVIGKKPIHLMKPDEREKVSKLSDLWIDVGVDSRDAALALGLRVGDAAVIDARMIRLAGDRIASRAIDNRIGAFVVLEALRRLRERAPAAEVVAVATTQEEIGYHGGGARASAFRVDPQVALAVDVTFAGAPQIESKQTGEHRLGGGPVLGRGAAVHPLVFERLVSTAEATGIPYSIQANARTTSTDADAIYLSRSGVATGLVSVPNRYMHSPNEMVALADLDATIRLMVEFIAGLDGGADFVPR
jgi:endoglucanase